MKQTKEQLIGDLAKIRSSHADWVSGDERRRKEFAKAFNWGKRKNGLYDYNHDWEWTIPSWEQIFVETGKLLASRNFTNYEGNISELECKLDKLYEMLSKR